jgi:hypothetical protein
VRETKRGPARPLTHPLSCPLLPSLTLSLAPLLPSLSLSCALLLSLALSCPLFPVAEGMEGQWSGNGRAMQGMEGMEAHCAPSLSARSLSLSLPGCLSLSFLARPPAVSFFLTLIFLSLTHLLDLSVAYLPPPTPPPSGMEGAMEGQWRGNGRAMQGMEGMEAHCAPSLSARALSLSLAPAVSLYCS